MLKQFLERNAFWAAILFVVSGFAAGWFAHIHVQDAGGQTSISRDYLKELERRAVQGKETLLTENELLRARIGELESETSNLNEKILKNRPKGASFISRVTLTPNSPAKLKVNEKVVVAFDYTIAQGETAYLWARDATPVRLSINVGDGKPIEAKVSYTTKGYFEPSLPVTGSGRAERYFYLSSPGEVKEITITIQSEQDEELHEMKIPVKYVYK